MKFKKNDSHEGILTAEDWNREEIRLDDPVRMQSTPEPEPVPPDTLDDPIQIQIGETTITNIKAEALMDEPEKIIPLDELPPHIFDDFSEYTAGLRHLKDGPISRMRRRSFLSGLIIGLLTSSLIWFIMLVAYGVIIR